MIAPLLFVLSFGLVGYTVVDKILKLREPIDVYALYIHQIPDHNVDDFCKHKVKIAASFEITFNYDEKQFASDTVRHIVNCTNEFNCTKSSPVKKAFNNDYIDYSDAMTLKTPTHVWRVSMNMYMYVNLFEKGNKLFYHVFMKQPLYRKSLGYMAIYKAMEILKTYYPGEYIICGSFGVPRWDLFFKHFLPNYHIMDANSFASRRIAGLGYVSIDGMLISKKLYECVHFIVERYTRTSMRILAVSYTKNLFFVPTLTVTSRRAHTTNERLRVDIECQRLGINETILIKNEGYFKVNSKLIMN